MNELQQITELVKTLAGSDFLSLEPPLTVTYSSGFFCMDIHGLCVTDADELMVGDAAGKWYQIDESALFLTPLLNRVAAIPQRFKAFSL